jgi:hypothetical protein
MEADSETQREHQEKAAGSGYRLSGSVDDHYCRKVRMYRGVLVYSL